MYSDFDILRHFYYSNNSMQSVGLLLMLGMIVLPYTLFSIYYTNISDAVLLVTSIYNVYIYWFLDNITSFTGKFI